MDQGFAKSRMMAHCQPWEVKVDGTIVVSGMSEDPIRSLQALIL